MSISKLTVIKCVTALLISAIMASSLVAYAATDSHNTVTIVDGEKTAKISTHCTTAEEILSDANIILNSGDEAVLSNDQNGALCLTVKRAFKVYVTVGSETLMVNMTEGTVADALEKAGVVLGESSVCSHKKDAVLTKETYIDVAQVDYITESYEEKIPYTVKVEYSSSLKKGEKKVIAGKDGVRTVMVKKTLTNGVLTGSEVVSKTVTTAATPQVTIIGTKTAAKKPAVNKNGTKPYSSIKTISSLKAPASLTLTSKGIPTSYKKKVTVEATAYTDHSGTRCASGVLPQTGYIAVNPKVIPYGTKMFIVSADGKYVYGYAIAADTGGFIKKRPYNIDLFFNTKSECRQFGRRNVVIYFL